MNVQIKNQEFLNILNLLDIITWVAENEEFDSDPIMFSIRNDSFDDFINIIEDKISYTIISSDNFISQYNNLPIVDIKGDQLIIEDSEENIDGITTICIDRENHKKLLRYFT